jgi:integrase
MKNGKTAHNRSVYAFALFFHYLYREYTTKCSLSSGFLQKNAIFTGNFSLCQSCLKKLALPAENRRMKSASLLTPGQTASILNLNEHALNALVASNAIPHTYIQSAAAHTTLLRFEPTSLADWLQQGPTLHAMKETTLIKRLHKQFETRFPEAMQDLQALNGHFLAPRSPKGYSLSKVQNRQLGFVYYVRYIEHGKLIPSRWTTRTDNYDIACQFAVENRERLLEQYRSRKGLRAASGDLYDFMERYYAKGSRCLDTDIKRGRRVSEGSRRVYYNTVIKKWIPYLHSHQTRSYEDIDTPFLARYQNHLLQEGIKPQTINHYCSHVSKIFDYLVTQGHVRTNPFASLPALIAGEDSQEERGCYEIKKLKGVFNRKWPDELSYLLCLMIYTTNMRNCEIARLQLRDLVQIENIAFINIPKSKSKNGERLAPLHDFVCRKLRRYAAKHAIHPDDCLFGNGKRIQSSVWKDAYVAMGAMLGYDEARLAAEHITFYSGRHFWKTLMNSEELGDVEEYFMGHKVSNDVSRRYNHRDKQGRKLLARKARAVFAVLDRKLFRS